MIKWLAYIALMLICTPCLLSAATNKNYRSNQSSGNHYAALVAIIRPVTDTIVNKATRPSEDKGKIKEVAKAKRQSKPEKIDETGNTSLEQKVKPKRQRRPAGLQRPPEIPRRNGN